MVCCCSANAGQGSGRVVMVQLATHSKIVVFALDGENKEPPRCNETNRYAVNLSEPGGEVIFQSLLAAKRHGYRVRVTGLGTCRNEWKAEDTKLVVLE